jgi:hypothetical protein
MMLSYANMGIRKTQSALRHPQGNAPAERFNRYLNESLSIVLPRYNDWPRMLPMILFAYRALPQETTGFSPFYLMYGRHPLLPLEASTIAPFTMSAHAVDAELRTSNMVKSMAETFKIVRYRQDKASRINAARRDAKGNRYSVSFQTGDLVLVHEPDAVYGTTCAARPTPALKDDRVPEKWKFPWSGPHRVSSKMNNEDVYKVYHIHRRLIRTYHVDGMLPFHPFADIPLSGIPQAHHRPKQPFKDPSRLTYGDTPLTDATDATDVPDAPPPPSAPKRRTLKGPESIAQLQADDLFLATVPFNGLEPVSLMKFVAYDIDDQSQAQDDTPVIATWMGFTPLEFHINTRFHNQRWFHGWYQPKTGEFYFQQYPLHRSHPHFTNVLSVDTVLRRDIFLFGFKLQEQGTDIRRLPTEVVQHALHKFRTMDIPDVTEKNYMPGDVKTYECDDPDVADVVPPAHQR